MIQILGVAVLERRKEILGICLGMQLFCRESYEEGHHSGLNWIDCSVKKLNVEGKLRVPHMGWNDVKISDDSQLLHLHAKNEEVDFYFVHSYFVKPEDDAVTAGRTDYGQNFVSAVARDNLFAVQFHPEKSADAGLQLLENFVNW